MNIPKVYSALLRLSIGILPTPATNKSGFTGLPGGYRADGGVFKSMRLNAGWWSFTQFNVYYSWNRNLNYFNGNIGRTNYFKQYGLSVRCVKN